MTTAYLVSTPIYTCLVHVDTQGRITDAAPYLRRRWQGKTLDEPAHDAGRGMGDESAHHAAPDRHTGGEHMTPISMSPFQNGEPMPVYFMRDNHTCARLDQLSIDAAMERLETL